MLNYILPYSKAYAAFIVGGLLNYFTPDFVVGLFHSMGLDIPMGLAVAIVNLVAAGVVLLVPNKSVTGQTK